MTNQLGDVVVEMTDNDQAQTKTATQKGMSLEGRVLLLERRHRESTEAELRQQKLFTALDVLKCSADFIGVNALREAAGQVLIKYLQGK